MSDQIEGARAVAWGLRTLALITPPGSDRLLYLSEADKAMDDAARMKQLVKGWMQWGEHPWWVVHDKTEPTMARYNSDSLLHIKDGAFEKYFGGGCRGSFARKA